MKNDRIETEIEALGKSRVISPIENKDGKSVLKQPFITDKDGVLISVDARISRKMIELGEPLPAFEKAGPRRNIYFDPSKLRCAIATCGGLCPGLNDIIRAIVMQLFYGYGVKTIYGVQYGLQGFIPKYGHDIIDLVPEVVEDILDMGGSILGSSRGPQDIDEVVDCLERMNIGILFMVGGDGTMKAASKIADVITKRGLKISVVGIPKTIDNDIYLVARSFGFDTAVDVATVAIKGASKEAEAYPNCIGLVKLMGRHSGFIAATAALAQQDVNYVLIPEVEFDLDGPSGLLATLEKRLKARGHAVIVVAEGAGQKFFDHSGDAKDKSGNVILKDIGIFLKVKIGEYLKAKNMEYSIKYIDPSYMIRSLPANANDSVFCGFLGRDAVHAGIAGKTKVIIGHWNNQFVHVPMAASIGKRKSVLPGDKLWQTVLESTGQGSLVNG